MEYKRMKDEPILNSHPDHHHHHVHHRRRFLFIFSVMTFVVVISYIIIVGASFGIHQKNALIHGNYIANSSIIINIIVNGKNQSLSEEDNAIIFKIIGDVFDSDDIEEEDDYADLKKSSEIEDVSDSPSQSYEKIDKSIPISRGPLRIENPKKIPVLN